MNWERFHYICRRTLKELNDNETINECIERIEHSTGSDCYGESVTNNSISKHLLIKIKNKSERTEAVKALHIYSEIDFSNLLTEPMHFKRVIIYLLLVFIVFICISGIYHFMVTPAFLDAFKSFELTMPSELVFYQDYWIHIISVILILMLLSLYIGYILKSILTFKINQLDSTVVRFFLFKQIKSSYSKILDAISYPVSVTKSNSQLSSIDEHLNGVEKIGMNLATEIYSIVEFERKRLVLQSERLMRILSVLIAIAVISVIFNFVASAYSPMFVLGEIM